MIESINYPLYTEQIAPFIYKNIIKELTGQRCVGKSCILRQIQNHVEQVQPECNTIGINKELEELVKENCILNIHVSSKTSYETQWDPYFKEAKGDHML